MDANRELPLAQPPSAHPALTSGSCPGTPEMRRRQEEAMRRLASQVNTPTHTQTHTHTHPQLLILEKNVTLNGAPWEFSSSTSLGKSVRSNARLGSLQRGFWKEFYHPGKFISLLLHQIHFPLTLVVCLSQPPYFLITNVRI